MDWGRPSVEEQIRAAQARGDFDNLPGKGKPLRLNDVHDPDWWVKSYLRREQVDTSALVHPTIALRREADGFPESLLLLTREEQVRAILTDFNARVVAEWRRPAVGPTLPVAAHQVAVEPMVERWRVLRDQQAAGATDVTLAQDATTPEHRPSRRPERRLPWWRRLFT